MDENTINKCIGQKIKDLRKKCKLNQSQLADELSIHYKHLGRIENGKKPVSISLLVKLCNFFKKDISYFFDFTQQKLSTQDSELIKSMLNMLQSLDSDTRALLAHMIQAACKFKNKN